MHPGGLATRGHRRRGDLPGPCRHLQPGGPPGGRAIAGGTLLTLRACLPVGWTLSCLLANRGGSTPAARTAAMTSSNAQLHASKASPGIAPRVSTPSCSTAVSGAALASPSPTTVTVGWSAVTAAGGSDIAPLGWSVCRRSPVPSAGQATQVIRTTARAAVTLRTGSK